MVNNYEEALKLLHQGEIPIPITAGQKYPPVFKGWQNYKSTEDDVARYFKDTRLNLAILVGNRTIVDIDDMQELDWAIATFGETRHIVKTASGNWQMHYTRPIGRTIIKCQGRAVDILSGNGRYALMPNSETAKGVYEYFEEAEMSPFPKDVIEETVREARREYRDWDKFRIRRYLRKVQSHAGNGGDNQLFRAAKFLIDAGLSEDEAFEELSIFNCYQCEPPWNEKRLRYKIQQAMETRK